MIDQNILLSSQYIKNLEIAQGSTGTLYQDSTRQTVPVVKLFVAAAFRKWINTKIFGVLCYVQERKHKCQFLRILDINTLELLFQAELQHNFMDYYQRESESFYHFEIDKGFIGFSYQDPNQAKKMNNLLVQNTKLSRLSQKDFNIEIKKQIQFLGLQKQNMFEKASSSFISIGKKLFGGDKKIESEVQSVEQKVSIKWDFENDCMITDNLPQMIKEELKKANIKKQDLKDPDASKVIFDLLQEHIQQQNQRQQSIEIKEVEIQKSIEIPINSEKSKNLAGPKLPVNLNKGQQNARANLLDEIRKPNINNLKKAEQTHKPVLSPMEQMMQDIKNKKQNTLVEKLQQQKQQQTNRIDYNQGSDFSD